MKCFTDIQSRYWIHQKWFEIDFDKMGGEWYDHGKNLFKTKIKIDWEIIVQKIEATQF